MKTSPLKETNEQAPELVAAPAIARRMSVTGRYILQLAEQGRIPCVRIGPKCVRFSPDAVAKALGFTWGAAQ
jgi:excisionase family DNA binding protein